MPAFQWLLIALSVSVDAFFVGAATALSGSKLKPASLLCIGGCVLAMSALAAYAGLALGKPSTIIGSLLLLCVGISYIVKKNGAQHVGVVHSFMLGAAVGADAAAASIIIGGSGVNPIVIGMVMSILHILLVTAGNSLPSKLSHERVVRIIGGSLLVVLALMRLI